MNQKDVNQRDEDFGYLYKLIVEEDALDEMNHVNNLVFLQYCNFNRIMKRSGKLCNTEHGFVKTA